MQAKGSGRFAALVVALLIGLGLPPAAGARLEAPPVELLPGLEGARASKSAGVHALARHLPKGLARGLSSVRADAAAAAGEGQRVQVTALELRNASRARKIVSRWAAAARRDRAKPRRARVGSGGWLVTRRAAATLVWRGRSGLGVVELRGRADPLLSLGNAALGYARYADQWVSASPPASAWERVTNGIRPDGTLSRRTAMEAFAVAYGGLPGVRVPSGPAGNPAATMAAQWIQRYYRTLSPKLARVVDKKLGLPRGGRARKAFDPGADDPTFTHDPALEAEVHKYIYQVYYPLIGGPVDVFDVVAGTSSAKASANADAGAFDPNGDTAKYFWDIPVNDPIPAMQTCRVRVFPNWSTLPPGEQANTLAHEAMHCVQNALAGDQLWKPSPPWLYEGVAEWAAGKVAPIPYDNTTGAMRAYLENQNPLPPIFALSYHAVSLFGHIDDTLAGGYWTRLRASFQAPVGQPDVIFHAAGAAEPPAYDSWASSRFRIPSAGQDWMMGSPITPAFPMPTYDMVKPGALQMLPGPSGVGHLTAPNFSVANGLIHADPSAPIVVVSTNGHARLLSDFGEDATVPEGGLWLCASGSCECPEGTTGQTPETQPWGFPSALALRGAGGVTVQALSIEDYCQPPPPGSGDPLDCSGGCGSSNGDPHLATLDGLPYDFQAAGEFTLVSSPSGDLEVQARQQAARVVGDVPSDTLSVNTALAMRVAKARIGLYAGKNGFRLEVDGRQVKAPAEGESIGLRGGGALAGRAGQLAVLWPDGSEARVWSVGKYGVATILRPAPERAGRLAGLLGDFDGNSADDFATRGGKQLDAEVILADGKRGFKQLYDKFGESWRIGRRASLFDYPGGRDTRSYTDRRLPKRPISVASLPEDERRRAEEICRNAGVRDPVLLENCILDVAATGQAAFARDAVTLEATAKRSGAWTRLSSVLAPGGGGHPTLAAAGDRVVAAFRRGDTALEAASFVAGPGGPRDVARTTAVEGFQEVGAPFLLPAPGGGQQLFFYGAHAEDPADPLNGALLSQRQADGAFGSPARAAEGYLPFLDAVTASSDGVPLWATFNLFQIQIWRGAQNASSTNLDGFATGVPLGLAFDSAGRLWLAWEDYTGPGSTAELFVGRLDPATGGPAAGATPQQVPVAGAETFEPMSLACASACRLVFSDPQAEGRMLSWAPGEAGPTEVVASGADLGVIAAAAAPDGRVWTAWSDAESGRWRVLAKLGDGAGAGGTPVALRGPTGDAFPGDAAALALPGGLILAVDWFTADGSAVWGAVVPGG